MKAGLKVWEKLRLQSYPPHTIFLSQGVAPYLISPLEGIQKMGVSVEWALGCDVPCQDTSGFSAAVNVAKSADVVIVVVGLDESQERCVWGDGGKGEEGGGKGTERRERGRGRGKGEGKGEGGGGKREAGGERGEVGACVMCSCLFSNAHVNVHL